MADWPREIHGHIVARQVDFFRGSSDGDKVVHTFHCVSCNHQFTGPDDPRLQEITCDRLVRTWQP